ncbi:hypothetical protein MHYP_G00131090 [Metynnis hypsauchen]
MGDMQIRTLCRVVALLIWRLTDRQLQVMLGGLHQMFTRDDITRLSTDIEKIVTTVSQKMPKLFKKKSRKDNGGHADQDPADQMKREQSAASVQLAGRTLLRWDRTENSEDGEHALKKLHCIIDAVYTDLVRRMTSEYRLIEAVKTNSEQLPGSLARSIIIALKNADHKGCESEERLRLRIHDYTRAVARLRIATATPRGLRSRGLAQQHQATEEQAEAVRP